MKNDLLRQLPKIDDLLLEDNIINAIDKYGRTIVVDSIREAIDKERKEILSKNEYVPNKNEIVLSAIKISEESSKMNLRKVINATGTILHTNLGRARLSKKACNAVVDILGNYSNLEYNLENGKRGERYDNVTQLLTKLTGAESAIVVNNNAAAVLLSLSALANGKKVIVSRGEQVEIGGMFRIPEILEQSGSILKEVGTTNKTHYSDYENAIDDESVILKVHTSNYKIIGFTEEVEIEQLVYLGKLTNIPIIYDLGSGAMIDFENYGISGEPHIKKAVEDGADIICFSGDKLLGGPQAGIIIGKNEYIDLIKKHPLTRAFRIDKMTLAALEGTLREYIDETEAIKNIPILRQILMNNFELLNKAELLYSLIIHKDQNIDISIIKDKGTIGGGSMPASFIDTFCIAIKSEYHSVNEVEKRLRNCRIPIIARISKDTLLLDLLTIDKSDLEYVAECVINCVSVGE